MQEYKVYSPDGTEIAIFEYGNRNGIELIFIHGFAGDHHVWEYQVNDKKLSDLCRIITVDLRGHGKSSIPESDEAYANSERWADDLNSVINQCGLIKPIVIAWSYGGRLINDYLLKYGQSKILAVNYVAAASLNDISAVGPEHTILATMCSQNLNDSLSADNQFVEKVFGSIKGTECYKYALDAVQVSSSNLKAKIRNRSLIYDQLLSSITIPVLATHGEDDTFVFKKLSINLAKTVKNGQLSIYLNTGHAPFVEQPNRFNKELLNFICYAHD